MRNIVVNGTIAYDNIMVFDGEFKENIQNKESDSFNIDIVTNRYTKTRGGTATNIGYNLKLIGENPIINATAGKDFHEYKLWLEKNKINTDNIKINLDEYTSTCFMITDKKCNMIAGFYSGAMELDIYRKLGKINIKKIDMVIIAPTNPKAMVLRAEESKNENIPYLIDPGMLLSRFKKDELLKCIFGANILVMNEHEFSLLTKKINISKDEIIAKVGLLVITQGKEGSLLQNKFETVNIPAIHVEKVIDPIGAGDAYKAGLIKAYLDGLSILNIGEYASVSASFAIERKGAMEHEYNLDEFYNRLNKFYPQ